MYYKGEITDNSIGFVIAEMETCLYEEQVSTKVHKKIIYIIIECLQNIYHYFKDKPYQENLNKESCLDIVSNSEYYTINVSNYVYNAHCQNIIKKIDYINALSTEELHELYLKVLSSQKVSPTGGAGLGLIDIARKSSKKLSYSLAPDANGDIYFTLQISIPNN